MSIFEFGALVPQFLVDGLSLWVVLSNVSLAAKTFMGRGLGPKNNVGSAPVSIFSFFDPEGLLPCWVRG